MQLSRLSLVLPLHLRPENLVRFVVRRLAYSALAQLLCVPLVTGAQEPAHRRSGQNAGSEWGIGVMAGSSQRPYAGIDRGNLALPLLFFDNRWVRVMGPSVAVKLPRIEFSPTSLVDLDLVARYDRSGYEAGDAAILFGMEERKDGMWAGGRATWRTSLVDMSGEALTDVSSYSKSYRATVSFEKGFRVAQRVMLTPRLSAIWLSSGYVDYYYGVRGNEARAGRAAYVGHSAINAEIGARAAYLFDRSHTLFLDASVTRLADEIRSSPLVDRSSTNRVSVGYMYRF